jgi:hypothetical protein
MAVRWYARASDENAKSPYHGLTRVINNMLIGVAEG